MNPRRTLVAFVIVLTVGPACGANGGSGQPTPSPTCPASSDNVSVRNDVISISNVAAAAASCQVVTDGTDISASKGGIADARFGSDGLCSFYQLQPAIAGAQLKTAYYTTRPSGGALFHVDNGEADCTLQTGLTVALCGQETLFPDGTLVVALHIDCNMDPVVNVAVIRGSVTVKFTAAPNQFRVSANHALRSDPAGNGGISPAQFTTQQKALFDTQLDSLLNKTSSADPTSLLKAFPLTPSENVVAPNALQTFLGKDYGVLRSMCASASVPVIFYPTNPTAPTPVLYGGPCGVTKTARIYGIAIYQPEKLTYVGAQFDSEAGGSLVKNEIFTNPITLEFGSPRQVYTWKGDTGWVAPAVAATPQSPGQAVKTIYVAKFLYDLPPDTTPRIGLVAISYGGAAFPPIIG